MSELIYQTELREVTLPMAEYIRNCRDAERVQGYCRSCRNYGRHWGCPPYDRDIAAELAQYDIATLVCLKITFADKQLTLEEAFRLLQPERLRLEELVRSRESGGGRAFGLAGMCPYCKESCARVAGLPCRHPELVRSSLEAYGFDVVRTAELLFNLPIRWSSDGKVPEYLTFVVGYFDTPLDSYE